MVQSVFHKELFSQLTPTLGDLYSVKTEDKQSEFAKYMGMWQNLSCRNFGASRCSTILFDSFIASPLLTNDDDKDDDNDSNETKNDNDNDIAQMLSITAMITTTSIMTPKRLQKIT